MVLTDSVLLYIMKCKSQHTVALTQYFFFWVWSINYNIQ